MQPISESLIRKPYILDIEDKHLFLQLVNKHIEPDKSLVDKAVKYSLQYFLHQTAILVSQYEIMMAESRSEDFNSDESIYIALKPYFAKVVHGHGKKDYRIAFITGDGKHYKLKENEEITLEETEFFHKFLHDYQSLYELQFRVNLKDFDSSNNTTESYAKLLGVDFDRGSDPIENIDKISDFWHITVISKVESLKNRRGRFIELKSRFEYDEKLTFMDRSRKLKKRMRQYLKAKSTVYAERTKLEHPLMYQDNSYESQFQIFDDLIELIKHFAFKRPADATIPAKPKVDINRDDWSIYIEFDNGTKISSPSNKFLFEGLRYDGNELMYDPSDNRSLTPKGLEILNKLLDYFHACYEIQNRAIQKRDSINFSRSLIQYFADMLDVKYEKYDENLSEYRKKIGNRDRDIFTKEELDIENAQIEILKAITFWKKAIERTIKFRDKVLPRAQSLLLRVAHVDDLKRYRDQTLKDRKSTVYAIFDKFPLNLFIEFAKEEIEILENYLKSLSDKSSVIGGYSDSFLII